MCNAIMGLFFYSVAYISFERRNGDGIDTFLEYLTSQLNMQAERLFLKDRSHMYRAHLPLPAACSK